MSYQGASPFRRFRGGYLDPPPDRSPDREQFPASSRPASGFEDTAAYQDPASFQHSGYSGGAGQQANGDGDRYVYQSATGRLNRPYYQDPAAFQAPTGGQGPVIFQNPASPPGFGAGQADTFGTGPAAGFETGPGLADPTAYQGLSGLQDQGFADTAGYQIPDQGAATAIQETGRRDLRRRGGRGLLAGAAAGLLAGGVAIGVAMLAAAFVRPQASPVIAVGEAAIDRTPSAVKEFAIQYFGENDKTMLLSGMYIVIAIIAMVIGVLALRRLVFGVIGMAGFGIFGAFIALTRPESHTSDVVPSLIGGVAGIAALVFLVWAAAPQAVSAARRARGVRTDPATTYSEVTR